jgi:uncharacterized membrane protein YadS
VLLFLSLTTRTEAVAGTRAPDLRRLAPPIILGFLAMIALRSTGLVPPFILGSAAVAASGLTVMAMAALGLSVDVRTVAKAGVRTTAVVISSLLALGAISLLLIMLLGMR